MSGHGGFNVHLVSSANVPRVLLFITADETEIIPIGSALWFILIDTSGIYIYQ